MNASKVLSHLALLKDQGVTFTLRPDGRFTVDPRPAPDSALFQWCRDNREAIARELWLASQEGRADSRLVEECERFLPGRCLGTYTWEHRLEELMAMLEAEQGESRVDVGLRVLSRVIGLLGEQGRSVEQSWAIQAFLCLGRQALQDSHSQSALCA